jgi:hypothetical protein
LHSFGIGTSDIDVAWTDRALGAAGCPVGAAEAAGPLRDCSPGRAVLVESRPAKFIERNGDRS